MLSIEGIKPKSKSEVKRTEREGEARDRHIFKHEEEEEKHERHSNWRLLKKKQANMESFISVPKVPTYLPSPLAR